MNRNKLISSFIFAFMVIYLFIYVCEFNIRITSPYWPVLTRVVLGLIIITLVINFKAKWAYRILGILAIIFGLTFILPRSGLWTYSLNKYVLSEKNLHEEFIEELDIFSSYEIGYVSCRDDVMITRPKLNQEDIQRFSKPICRFFEMINAKEVWINRNKNKYLFVLYRLMDNGYGLLYIKSSTIENNIYSEKINGLLITSVRKVNEQWYYVTFT